MGIIAIFQLDASSYYLVFIVLQNMFMAILNDTYSETKEDVENLSFVKSLD